LNEKYCSVHKTFAELLDSTNVVTLYTRLEKQDSHLPLLIFNTVAHFVAYDVLCP